jgi:hypothetical protein
MPLGGWAGTPVGARCGLTTVPSYSGCASRAHSPPVVGGGEERHFDTLPGDLLGSAVDRHQIPGAQ